MYDAEAIKLHYGDVIKQRRRRMGLSQAALAKKANIKRDPIATAELGRTLMDMEHLLLVLDALGITFDEMVQEAQYGVAAAEYDATKVNYNFGLAMRRLRKRKKMRLEDVSERCGISTKRLSSYEIGDYQKISLEAVLKVCNALDVRIESFITMCNYDNFAEEDE